MKRKSILFSMMLILLALPLNAQIEIEQETSSEQETESATQGFFVKGGSQKIDALECYTFKDLILSFDLKEEHFNCDGIDIEIFVGKKMYNKGGLRQEEFTALFGGKKYAYFKVFSSEDMKERSKWGFTRSLLQHTNIKRDLDGTKMVVKVFCGKITGEEEISEVISDKVVTRKKKIWKWDESTAFSIELKNRIYIKPLKFMVSDYPKEPVATGDCYE
ncbi:hypothetical protein [Flavobacterium sp. HNIBRBA15423]|uniref:hypothetical protein n=1 Tax=Flavobacterium sp. HNIBRBA15423 TaxID=3458683 RepID=UPI004043C1D1